MFDNHLKRWQEEKAYAQKQNASAALLSKKKRQNLSINSGTNNYYPSKITVLLLQSKHKVFILYLNIFLPLTGWGQCVLSTKFLCFASPNNVSTFFKNLLLQWSAIKENCSSWLFWGHKFAFSMLRFLSLFIPSYPLKCSLLCTRWFMKAFNHLPKIKFGRRKYFQSVM